MPRLPKYFFFGFVLLIPPLLWNLIFANSLPSSYAADIFWKDIPPLISYGENTSRILAFALSAFLVWSLQTKKEILGMGFYLVGLWLYFAAWIFQILYPESTWCQSLAGFSAPAYTSLFWLLGIGLLGQKTWLPTAIKVNRIYFLMVMVFVVFHTWHAVLVFGRL
jgi:hypothetical protein